MFAMQIIVGIVGISIVVAALVGIVVLVVESVSELKGN